MPDLQPISIPAQCAGRIDSVLGHTGTALRELRSGSAPGALSGVTAECWRAYLGPIELHFMAAVALQASPTSFRNAMIRALELDQYWLKLRQDDREKYELEKKLNAEYWAKRLKNALSLIPEYGQTDWLKEELAHCRSAARAPA